MQPFGHLLAPTAALYWPARHGVHALWSGNMAKVPAAQAVQFGVDAPTGGKDDPAGQWKGVQGMELELLYVPDAHAQDVHSAVYVVDFGE